MMAVTGGAAGRSGRVGHRGGESCGMEVGDGCIDSGHLRLPIRVFQRWLQILQSLLIERAETVVRFASAHVEWGNVVGLWRISVSLSHHCLVHLCMVARWSGSHA